MLFFPFILLQSSCGDSNCIETGDCPPLVFRMRIEGAKDYLYADTGSWWIYINNKTGELDTHTVKFFRFDTVTRNCSDYNGRNITIVYDYLVRTIYSSYNKWEITDITSGYYSCDYSYYNAPEHKVLLTRKNSEGGNRFVYKFPFIPGAKFHDYYSTTSYSGIDSTITLRGKTYSKVARFEVEHDNTWFGRYANTNAVIEPTAVYYWAKDVGIISRFNVSNHYSWELVDYKINR